MATPRRQPHPSWAIASRAPLRGEIAQAIARECGWLAAIARDRDPAVAVHRVRQSTKRLRALARLLRPSAGEECYKSWNTELRDLARSLAGRRDADVWAATYLSLASSNVKFTDAGKLTNEAGAIQIEVFRRAARINGTVEIQDVLLQIVERIIIFNESWQRSLPKRITRDSVRLGLQGAFRRAKKQYKIAQVNTNSETLHELRKRIKTVRAQVEFLKNLFEARPHGSTDDSIRDWLAKTEVVSKILGEEHDLAMFLTITNQLKNAAVSKRICEKARRKRGTLRKQSLANAKDVFAFDPSEVL